MSLTGRIAGNEPLRHTPAGLPLFRFRLSHESVQVEAGYRRRVECEVSCVAVGDAATEAARIGAGAAVQVTGFLNRRNRMSAHLTLHLTRIELLKDRNDGNDEQGGPRKGQGEGEAQG